MHRAENTYVYHTKIRNDLFLSEVSLWQMIKENDNFSKCEEPTHQISVPSEVCVLLRPLLPFFLILHLPP